MDKEFTPYKEALDLKELGFDGECLGYFDDKGLFYYTSNPWDATSEKGMMDKPTSAPLYQQAFRWFRNKYNLVSEIQAPDGSKGTWNPTIHKAYGFGNHYDNDGFITYKEAELACLRKLIEIVKEK